MAGSKDTEQEYWSSLGFDASRDPQTGELIARDKWSWLRKLARKVEKPQPVITDPRKRNIVRYPGKGSTDAQWRKYAAEKFNLPGAIVVVPQIGSGRRRGLDIMRLIQGDTIEYKWNCGCRQVGDNYYPCGLESCDVNPK